MAASIEQAEAELEAAVAAPVAEREDPTLWLPDELLLLILVQVMYGRLLGVLLFNMMCET